MPLGGPLLLLSKSISSDKFQTTLWAVFIGELFSTSGFRFNHSLTI